MNTGRLTSGAAVMLLLLMTACSSGSDYCEQKDAVATSFEALAGTAVVGSSGAGPSGIRDEFVERYEALTAEFASFVETTREEFGDEAAAAQRAVEDMSDVLRTNADMDPAERNATLTFLYTDLRSTLHALLTAVDTACE